MALDKSIMSAGFLPIIDASSGTSGLPQNQNEAGQRWAAPYAAYALTGQSCQGVPPIIAGADVVLASALGAAFSSGWPGQSGEAAVAMAIDNALTAFWLAPPVLFVGVDPGEVIAVAGMGTLAPALQGLWASIISANPPMSAADIADQYATIFDDFTKTVMVAHVGPNAPCALALS